MANANTEWDTMLDIAKTHQQEYYELLPEWTRYKKDEYKYLKQNIGYALFGPPMQTDSTKNQEDNTPVHYYTNAMTDDADVSNALYYEGRAKEIINVIYKKVCEFGEGQVNKDCIHYGIIYNVLLHQKSEKEQSSATDSNKDEKNNINVIPIFKIRRYIRGTYKGKHTFLESWYIDVNGRVYKNWEDYKKNNTLPKGTMVLPKDGFYQPHRAYEITEERSTVWVEIVKSPACDISKSVVEGIDTVSNVAGIAGLTIAVASLFTPVGPIVLAGASAATGANCLWTIGRSTRNLANRSSHEESINPLESGDAFGSWLAITGSTVGLAASGGTVLLTRAVERGKNIGTVTRMAYNSLVVGNLSINGIGVGYQVYNMYQKYRDGDGIDAIDVVFLGSHILFFGNSVINLQFAGEVIRSTQGRVIDDYKASLRSKRLRKAFNRAKRNAAANNTNAMTENAEVICYINKKTNLSFKVNANKIFTYDFDVSFCEGKLCINGIAVLDPMTFLKLILESDWDEHNAGYSERRNYSSAQESSNFIDMSYKLTCLLKNLLTEFYSNENCESKNMPDITQFDSTLQDMKYIKSATNILPLIFELAVTLIKKSDLCREFLVKAVHFIWCYVKENLRRISLNVSSRIDDLKTQKALINIIHVLFAYMDRTVNDLFPAFIKYICNDVEINHAIN